MLLDEDPATLIHHTVGNFNIAPDKLAVSRINDSISTLHQARDLRIREAESALKKLSRTHQTLNNAHIENLSSHSSTAHASEIATLDTQKFRIAKTANDVETESERLSSQLLDLQSRLQELDTQGVEGGDMGKVGRGGRSMVDDEITLKLKVYRSLGFELADDPEGADYKKVLVKNEMGGMHVVKLEDKFSRHFVAGYLWKMVA